jgi:type I restriction enzyme S subunit
MKYTRYPEYKDSGVEWIGEIPEHWMVTKLKFISCISADYGINLSSDNYINKGARFIRITDINEDGTLIPDGVYIREDLTKDKVLEKGDLLFARSGSVGTSYLFNFDDSQKYSFAGYLVRFRLKMEYSPSFVYLFSQSKLFKDQIKMNSIETTIENFNGEKYSNLKICLPDTKNQKQIVSSLGKIFTNINSLISKISKMSELLKEKRQAIITNAVTKGLDQNAPMKDSGVEWIGEIPEHWLVKKLKTVSKIQFSNVDKHSFDGEMPVLLANYTDVYKNQFITNEMKFMEATAKPSEIKKFQLEVGDVLVTKDSETTDDIAIPSLVKRTIPNLICGYHLAQIRPRCNELNGSFLFYLYCSKTFRGKYESEANGITRFGLSQYSFADTYICLPNLAEQLEISSFLAAEISKIDFLISKQKEMIDRLKEYKESLINQAVTGKIDLRGFNFTNNSNSIQS